MFKTNKLAVLMVLALTNASAFASENQTFMDKVMDRAGHLGSSIKNLAGSILCTTVTIVAVPSSLVAIVPLESALEGRDDIMKIRKEEARLRKSQVMTDLKDATTFKGPKISLCKKEAYFKFALFSFATATCTALPLFIAYKSGAKAIDFGGKSIEEGKKAFQWSTSANNEKIERVKKA